ncbi:MAG: hypothetical protein LBN10_07620 [Propionibacteriaceae bacterium]|jgi:hypothetical protein|nr:hypothetical protein [Propionibacteriaceae bacterium]
MTQMDAQGGRLGKTLSDMIASVWANQVDFIIDVKCTHSGEGVSHDPTRVALIEHGHNRLLSTMDWTAGVDEDDDPAIQEKCKEAQQTYLGNLAKLAKGIPPDERKGILDSKYLLTSRKDGVMGRDRWRFECLTCGYTLTVTWGKLRPILEKLKDKGIEDVTIQLLSSIV